MSELLKGRVECQMCEGTGIFEVIGNVGLLCHQCSGSGYWDVEFTKFTGRKLVDVATVVQFSFMQPKEGIPYKQFLELEV